MIGNVKDLYVTPLIFLKYMKSLFNIKWVCLWCEGLGYKGHNGPYCWQCNARGYFTIKDMIK
jgi:hypothetical protein